MSILPSLSHNHPYLLIPVDNPQPSAPNLTCHSTPAVAQALNDLAAGAALTHLFCNAHHAAAVLSYAV